MPPQSFGSRSVPNREGVAHVIACKESRYRKVGIDIRWLGERGLAFHKSPTKEKIQTPRRLILYGAAEVAENVYFAQFKFEKFSLFIL